MNQDNQTSIVLKPFIKLIKNKLLSKARMPNYLFPYEDYGLNT